MSIEIKMIYHFSSTVSTTFALIFDYQYFEQKITHPWLIVINLFHSFTSVTQDDDDVIIKIVFTAFVNISMSF